MHNDSTNNTHAASMAVLEKQIEQHIGDDMDHGLMTLDGKSGFHAMGLIKVTTPKNNANQLEIDENRMMQREKIVKNEILSNMEGLQHYVSQPVLETKLTKYEQLLQKVPERSIPIDVAVKDWYNG